MNDLFDMYPLSRFLGAQYFEYYLDRNNNVWSHKRPQLGWYKMQGQNTLHGEREFTLTQLNGVKRKFTLSYLLAKANQMTTYKDFMRGYSTTTSNNQFINSVMKGSSMNETNPNNAVFIIGSVSPTGDYSFSASPVEHRNHTLARQEAERLARTNPGRKFVIFQRVGSVQTQGVVWGT